MRTVFFVSALLFVSACSSAPPLNATRLGSGGWLATDAGEHATRIDIETADGTLHHVEVARDPTTGVNVPPTRVDIVAEIAGRGVIFVDTYPSAPLGMSLCQAGEERFLRVVSLLHDSANVTVSRKLESCRENIELASPGLEWRPQSATLLVHWLPRSQNDGLADELVLHLGADLKPLGP